MALKSLGTAVVLLLTLGASGAAVARDNPPSLKDHLIALEKRSWDAWQRMDARFWQDFLSDDHLEIQPGGVADKKAVIAGIASRQCAVKTYRVDRFSFRQLGADAAVLAYWAAQDTTCGSIKVPSPVWATSIYQRRNGRWQNVLYEHTPALQRP
jgi:hypothetical protein